MLHVRRIGQDERHVTIRQHVPNWLPVNACCFHADVSAAALIQPVRQRQQSGCRRVEPANLGLHRALGRQADTRHHRVLVHVQTGAARIKNLALIA